MSQQVPNIPVGKDPITTWYNKVSNAIPANRLATSPDFLIHQSSRGTSMQLKGKGLEGIYASWCGNFDPDSHYAIGDVVYVESGVNYTSSISASVSLSASVGTWVCESVVPDNVVSNGIKSWASGATTGSYVDYIRKSGITYYPIYPMPSTLASETTDGNGRYWRLIGSATTSSATGASPFLFKSMGNEFIVCRSWDGTSSGSGDVIVAKPFKLRESAPDVTIDGDGITYSAYDWANQRRTATISGVGKYEVITPRYCVDDVIWADQPTYTCISGSGPSGSISWMDTNRDGRAWAYKKGQ